MPAPATVDHDAALRLIERAAEQGQRAPSLARIARAARCSLRHAVNVLDALHDTGRIRIVKGRRLIRIVLPHGIATAWGPPLLDERPSGKVPAAHEGDAQRDPFPPGLDYGNDSFAR